MSTRYVDHLGRDINVGDVIVYATTVGRSADLVRAVVMGETPKKLRVMPLADRGYGRKTDFRAPDFVPPNTVTIGYNYRQVPNVPGKYKLTTVIVLDDPDWPEVEVFRNRGWIP
jgi:hypothetical protein